MPHLVVGGLAYVAAIWSVVVILVQALGSFQVIRHCSAPPPEPVSPHIQPEEDAPHITVIRPVKDLEPRLYECLASTFHQTYPRSRMSVHLCISSRDDAAYPVLEQVVDEFGGSFDVRLFVESEDPLLHPDSGGRTDNLGPNPKIRNISRGYREARGPLIWILDCNIWVSKRAAGRMVDKLLGLGPGGVKLHRPYKLVHQLPMSVDLTSLAAGDIFRFGGGRLDEMFMGTSHAKFYSAINTVGVAPCLVGKSNMFRKAHLDALTDPSQNPILKQADAARGRGIDFFSSYICEDHLIGELLWRSSVPGHANHGLLIGDVALQPLWHTSVAAYWARRVRWLRVRKWTVLLATLVEPGVESILCCLYLAFALTTIPWVHENLGIPQTWRAMGTIWAAAMSAWMALDWSVYIVLRACRSLELDDPAMPDFARGTEREGGVQPRRFYPDWMLAWAGRELLALPIWICAVLLGTTVNWRGKHFRVRMDMSVVELADDGKVTPPTRSQNGTAPSPLTNGNGSSHGTKKRHGD